MPPKRGRKGRTQVQTKDDIHKSSGLTSTSSAPAVIPPLAQLPPELFDEIVSYWEVVPLRYYSETYSAAMVPSLEYATRTYTLRALSQTCRALKDVCIPRLWRRLETCWVPRAENTDALRYGDWFRYVMKELKRKADGVMDSDKALRAHVRTLCIMTSKSEVAATLPSLSRLLPALPNLETFHVLHCNKAGDFATAVDGLKLPSVRVVVIPTECHSILKACPNATHVRVAGGNGAPVISSLKFCKVEKLDGMIDWGSKNIMDRLLKSAPNLHTLEIRRAINWSLGSRTTPKVWADVIPKLAKFSKLRVLLLSFPSVEELDTDLHSIAAARKVMKESKVDNGKKLVVRRIIAPHYTMDHKEDLIDSSTEETFD